MEDTYKLAIGGAALATGGYFFVDWFVKRDEPGASGRSAANRVAGAILNRVVPAVDGVCVVPSFKTYFPMVQGTGVTVSTVENHSLYGVAAMGDSYFGTGCGKMIALMASLETHTGLLRCACYNANLFNIHGNCNPGFVNYVGTDRNRSFTGNSTTVTIEAFQASLESFKRILERNANYMDALRSGDPDTFQRLIATVNFDGSSSGTYTSSVNGQTIVNPFFRRRYEMLRSRNVIP